MTKERIYLKDWIEGCDFTILHYSDGTTLRVRRADFNRAFGAILNGSKEEVANDFAV